MKFSINTVFALAAAFSASGVLAAPLDALNTKNGVDSVSHPPAAPSPAAVSPESVEDVQSRQALLPGLNAVQSQNAQLIISEVIKEGLGLQGCLCGITTAITESTLQKLANNAAPPSLNFPHEGIGSDNDSVGLFQQRVQFYQDVACDMDPACSAKQFFGVMQAISGWQTMEVGQLCQAVQRSEKPDAYEGHIPAARDICAAAGIH